MIPLDLILQSAMQISNSGATELSMPNNAYSLMAFAECPSV